MTALELVAHRGWAARHPENTLLAIRAALEVGARWVEVDVQLTSDLVPVLFHDHTMQRLCGVPGPVHAHTAQQVTGFSCGRPPAGAAEHEVRVTTLEHLSAMLFGHPQAHVFVEIKRVATKTFGNETVLRQVLQAVAPIQSRCVLISYSIPLLQDARHQCDLPLGAVFDRWSERRSAEVAELAPEYLFFDLEGLPPQGPLAVPGAKTVVFEVAEPMLARELAGRGVQMVETFDIGTMLTALGRARLGD